jgi:hypothetical protein
LIGRRPDLGLKKNRKSGSGLSKSGLFPTLFKNQN